MNSNLTAPTTTSFQWMLDLGVPATEVAWLERMSGSAELHLPVIRERVERIWKQAIGMMLQSATPIAHLAQALK